MLTNQNTTQENSKKCSRKRKKCKCITVITMIMLLASIICINASAIVMQENEETEYPYIFMLLDTEESSTTIEVSGSGEETINYGETITITTQAGDLEYQQTEEYLYQGPGDYRKIKLANYYAKYDTTIKKLYRVTPININLWEWSQLNNDTIIWQLWDFSFQISNIDALYRIELPYFNNSEIMGTKPLTIDFQKRITGNLDTSEGRYYTYDLDIPNIETIVEKAIETLKNESQSNITFQYEGTELAENNYVTKVYAEEGEAITIDFKEALSTILVMCDYFINGDNVQYIALLNYNDSTVNETISGERYMDFVDYVIENEFQRSAEITTIRKDKEVRLLNWLGNAISGVMNVEIFPNFSLGALLSVIIMIPIVLWILKLVAGG